MTNKIVTLAVNALDPDTWQQYEVEDVREFIVSQFKEWPSTARIYHKEVSLSTDITPSCKSDVENLGKLEGTFYVIVYPADPFASQFLWFIVLTILQAVLFEKPPIPTIRNTQQQSPNNGLSERTNEARPNARIPDIFGTVRSTPDLIAPPYTTFIANQEVEHSIMCIGKGELEIHDAYDDTTNCTNIAGTSVQAYLPNTSIQSGTPYFQIGDVITDPIRNVVRSNSVNGQVLRAPNSNTFRGRDNIFFKYPNIIKSVYNSEDDWDFTEAFQPGDTIVVENAIGYETTGTLLLDIKPYNISSFVYSIPTSTLPSDFVVGNQIQIKNAIFSQKDADSLVTTTYDLSGNYTITEINLITEGTFPSYTYFCQIVLDNPVDTNPQWNKVIYSQVESEEILFNIITGEILYDFAGSYTVLAVSTYEVILDTPSGVNPYWLDLVSYPSQQSPATSAVLTTSGDKWVGPFTLEASDRTQVWVNVIASNGLYKDSGSDQNAAKVTVELEVTPVDSDDVPTGSAQTWQLSLRGSAYNKDQRASTLKATTAVSGRCQVRMRRVTPTDLNFEGQVVDEVKWRDLYSVSPPTKTEFGNVTIVRSRTYATTGALSLKKRKLNMLVTRKLPQRVSGSTFSTTLYSTTNAADILSFICLDRYIGNRAVSEIDFDSIYDSIADVEDYFGTSKAAQFCYTFDSNNLSFEETVKGIADSVFCTAYRRGNIIKISFEKETDNSTLLFNHRNKLPGSETRTVRFGNQNDFDGVSFKYISEDDDAQVTYYIPEDMSAINPEEIESIGVRNKLQAHFHAWRKWNKIRYQNTITEFTATQEADLLVTNDRILVADNTRPDTQDGEVLSQNVLELTLSQNVDLSTYPEYQIFLQLYDGTVDSISITAGSSANKVILSRAPNLPLALDDDLYARTTYIIIGVGDVRMNAFLVSEKQSQTNFTSSVKAINYDARYYEKDLDYINGVVDESGNII